MRLLFLCQENDVVCGRGAELILEALGERLRARVFRIASQQLLLCVGGRQLLDLRCTHLVFERWSRVIHPFVALFYCCLALSLPGCGRGALRFDLARRGERHFLAVATVENAHQPVVVAARDRVIFVIMTACTGEGERQQSLASGGHDVVKLVGAVAEFFLLHRHVDQRAVPRREEAGRRDRLWIVRRNLVTGELPAHEGVEREIVVQCADDEVAETVSVRPVVVAFHAIAIGVARDVEPVPRPAFAVLRACQQLVDQGRRSSAGRFLDGQTPALHLFRRRRQSDEVEVEPSHQRARICLRRRRERFGLLRVADERIHRRAHPRSGIGFRLGRRDSCQRQEGPMLAVGIGDDHLGVRCRLGVQRNHEEQRGEVKAAAGHGDSPVIVSGNAEARKLIPG